MLDQAIRFGAILSQPEFNQGGLLLEVGSGREGITVFVEEQVIGVDISFRGRPAQGIVPIKASATALPLRDAGFDRVVCSDMLEHLTTEDRPRAIDELVRVTKGTLFLACPCGEAARRADSFLSRLYGLLGTTRPEWLQEHLNKRIPGSKEITGGLKQSGISWLEVPGESAITHVIVSLLISAKFLNNIWRSLFITRAERAKRIASLGSFLGTSPYRRLWVVDCTKE